MNQDLLEQLREFCASDCNRFNYLTSYLLQNKIPHTISSLAGSNFIIIKYDTVHYDPKNYYIKTLVAHYDRKEGTPGANDNSAAVFQLLELALFLKQSKIQHHNVQMVLSDHEETSNSDQIKEQGTYKLGMALKRLKITNCVFFNFDMCGVGDTLILSEAGERLLEDHRKTRTEVYTKLKLLRSYTVGLLETIKQGQYLSIRTPFSDNLGLLLQGYPAMQICVLPYEEAAQYQQNLETLKGKMQRLRGRTNAVDARSVRQKYSAIQPLTWRIRHTRDDTVDRLSPEAFKLMHLLLKKLVYLQIPL
ncbi:MAG: M28 family peptidase [Spirochaetales bacterium]|nr:M28 family peptidase [Spirochaetales bacterium]